MNIGPAWTDTRVDILKRMHADGLSAAKIAKELGVTRNTVCGKMARMGLIRIGTKSQKLMLCPLNAKPPTPVRTERSAYRKRPMPTDRRKSISPEPFVTELPQNQSEAACTIAQLTGHDDMTMCRYPLNEPAYDMLYCGAASSGPWCPRHRAIVFKPLGARSR